ncbi:MAG: MoxR family ATPase [Candidatus Eremiobacteraeota bacterium]|nr:MoxR family ATPase [Candidatus Eremiobacteraeota bacterium]MBV9648277.1 MoxR family ATPase [Candidatus Eremiobacteraeota bacterium]
MPDVEQLAQRLRSGMERIIVGNDEAMLGFLVALFAGGHILIEGVPGTAKTLFVRLVAEMLGVTYRRIQFTPDLMPSDVVGTTVFNPKTTEFSLRRGPVFTNVLLADEINRTPPKTQSALLEAMEERQVTIDGQSQPLDGLFIVCATQNPVEFEGTYPLPEAQLDRFFVRARTTYPSPAQECELLARVARGFDANDLPAAGVVCVATQNEVLSAQRTVRSIHVSPSLTSYVQTIAGRTRSAEEAALGASPRAAIALLVAAQASAAINGSDFVTPDDVKDVAPLVLSHRIVVRPEAELDGVTAERVVERVLASVEVPKDATTIVSSNE